MPDIGEGIAEVELVAWHVKVGDMVAEDQPLADVMTDKATVEIPAPVVGRVVALGGEVGQVMAVGGELIRLEVDGEGNLKPGADAPPARRRPLPPRAAAASARRGVQARRGRGDRARQGRRAGTVQARAAAPPPSRVSPARSRWPRRPCASAWDLGIELRCVHGSGPAGRIPHEDLDAYLQDRARRARPVAAWPMPSATTRKTPVIGLRRKIAQKMAESKRRIPHFSYVEEIDVTELEELRASLNQKWGATRGKLTLLPLLARAMVVALRDFPQINARYDDEAGVVTRHGAVHRHRHAKRRRADGAGDAPRGGARPLVHGGRDHPPGRGRAHRRCQPRRAVRLDHHHHQPGAAGRHRHHAGDQPSRGGHRGREPHRRAAGHRNGAVVARKLMNLSSSFDHRVVDGMNAARFIQAVRALLEQPALLFVE